MPATKSGNHIYITGSGNTLQTVCDDIADVAWIERTGVLGAYVFTMKGSAAARYFRIRNGGTLTIGDPADYSFNEILQLTPTASNRDRFYVDTGGALLVYGNVQITISTNNFYIYCYWYGKNYWRGNDTYRPKLTKVYRIYWYWNTATSSYLLTDIWDWEHVDCEDAWSASSGYWFYFNDIRSCPDHIFKDVVFDAKPGATTGQYRGYAAIYTAWNRGCTQHKILFEDCTVKHFMYGIMNYYGGVRLKNCLITENRYWGYYDYGHDYPVRYGHSKHLEVTGVQGQVFEIVDGCTFTANYWSSGSTRDAYCGGGALPLYKDCTFNSSYRNIHSDVKAVALIWTGNTFSGSQAIYSGSQGATLWVHALDLTVQDSNGNPVENASVHVRQKDGKEDWHFTTDSNGKPVTMEWLEGKIILVHKEQTSYAGAMDYWSDASNSTYHDITVAKDGYAVYHTTTVMDQERTLTVQLDPSAAFLEEFEKLRLGTTMMRDQRLRAAAALSSTVDGLLDMLERLRLGGSRMWRDMKTRARTWQGQ